MSQGELSHTTKNIICYQVAYMQFTDKKKQLLFFRASCLPAGTEQTVAKILARL
jgi:hypothetical protein